MATALALITATGVASPFFFFGMASGHDIAFHMASWLDAAWQWKQGVFLPRWTEWANFGYGEPRFIFYPPLSWLFGAMLGTLIRWKDVGLVFYICIQTFAGLSAYALLRRISDARWGALFGSVCFAMNPYALTIIYMRSDFAELLAIAFFPLLFLATLRLCGILADESTKFGSILCFAITFSAIWLSNAPAAVIATYSVSMVIGFTALQQRSLSVVGKGGAGILLGFGLAAFYMVPAVYEQRWVNIGGALQGGLAPAKNFLYTKTADSEHDFFNRIASNVAVVLVAWAIFGAAMAWRARKKADVGSERMGVLPAVTMLLTGATLLMLPITGWFWRYLPELKFVQFPWRWMSVVALCGVMCVAVTAKGKLKLVWLLVVTLAAGGSGAYLGNNTWWDIEDMPSLQTAVQEGTGFEGTDEYDPKGDDRTDLPQKHPHAKFVRTAGERREEGTVAIDTWTAEYRALRASTAQAARVAVRLVDYPAWRVTVDGKPIAVEHAPGTAQMIVPVPAGQSRVEIRFTRTMDRTIGGFVSVLSACGSIGLLLWGGRKRIGT